MNAGSTFTITKKVSFAGEHKARRNKPPDVASPAPSADAGPVPRVARLMALALHYERLMADGAITTQAEIASLSHVTRARVTQVMNMLHLAPDIQESILFLPPTRSGRDPLHERHIRPVVAEVEWHTQRRLWAGLRSAAYSEV
jgi:hypothetical protein